MERKVQMIMDASGDLSQETAQRLQIAILPIRLRIDDNLYLDDGSADFTHAFYHQLWRNGESYAQVEAGDGEEITIWLEKNTVYSPYRLQIITGNASRTGLFDQVQQAIAENLKVFKRLRVERGIFEHFNIKVLGSRLMFGGQAILAHEGSRMAQEGAALADISFYLQSASKRVNTLIAPGALSYLKERGVEGGYGWIDAKGLNMKMRCPLVEYRAGTPGVASKEKNRDAAITQLLKRVKAAISDGEVSTPFLVLSQAEAVPSIRSHPDFQGLASAASSKGIALELIAMSPASAIAAGPGAVAASWLPTGDEVGKR
jgi:fatty acid-binding protein DegV